MVRLRWEQMRYATAHFFHKINYRVTGKKGWLANA